MVPCLHQRNIYLKRKLRVLRDRKCISLVGANTTLTCAGRQTIPSEGRQHRADKRNLRKLGWTYRHGTVFAPRQYLYQKEANGMERPEMYFPSWCKKTHSPVRAVKPPCLQSVIIRSTMETCVSCRGHTTMAPCLIQRNI